MPQISWRAVTAVVAASGVLAFGGNIAADAVSDASTPSVSCNPTPVVTKVDGGTQITSTCTVADAATPTPSPTDPPSTSTPSPTDPPSTSTPTPTPSKTPTPTPTPSTTTKYGADPAKGASDASVVSRFGTGASVRLFDSTIAAPVHPAGASIVHTSYSLSGYGTTKEQALKDVAAGKYDAQITAAAKATPAGDVLEIMHEADHKISAGDATFDSVVAAKNHFYDVVKAAKPSVLVANTTTGWLADPKSGGNFQQYGKIKADIIGIDLDGIHPSALPYPNFTDEIAAAQAFVKTYAGNGYRYWAVPEFGAPRLSSDSSGSERAKWLTAYGTRFRDGGARYADAYVYESTAGNDFNALETSAWKAFVN